MTEDHKAVLSDAFHRWFRGNEEACRCAAMLTSVAHTWDDIVDADKTLTPVQLDHALAMLMLELPTNAFYRAARDQLQPVIMMTFLSWDASNQMERSPGPGDREKCYMLRAGLYQLFHFIATLAGGLAWGREIGPEIYRTYGETLENYDA